MNKQHIKHSELRQKVRLGIWRSCGVANRRPIRSQRIPLSYKHNPEPRPRLVCCLTNRADLVICCADGVSGLTMRVGRRRVYKESHIEDRVEGRGRMGKHRWSMYTYQEPTPSLRTTANDGTDYRPSGGVTEDIGRYSKIALALKHPRPDGCCREHAGTSDQVQFPWL